MVEDKNQELHNRILKIVSKIVTQRHRPCYQNIHVLLSRGGIELEESELKTFISGLLARGILVDKGRTGAESFRLVEVDICGNEEKHGEDVIITNAEISSTNSNSSNSSLNEFINNKFYETLINRIKVEVSSCVESKLMELNRSSVQSTHNDSVVVNENTNYLQINELNKELDSLRNELKSKNEIISTLMKETCVERDVVI